MESKICAVFSVAGAAIGAFLGGVDGLIVALIAAVAIDYVTGVLAAVREKRLSSETGFWGLVKKIAVFAMVGLAHLLDVHVLGGAAALRGAVIFFYLANEGISILENYARLGLKCPQKLKDILEQLREK